MTLETRATADVTVIYCKGRIVYREEAAAFSNTVADLPPQTRHIVLEFSRVEMLDCAGLGELAGLLLSVQASGGSLKLAAPRNFIRELLELTNLASVFEIHPTLGDAMLSCQAQVA